MQNNQGSKTLNIVVYNYINLSVGHSRPFALWVRIIPNLKKKKFKSSFFFSSPEGKWGSCFYSDSSDTDIKSNVKAAQAKKKQKGLSSNCNGSGGMLTAKPSYKTVVQLNSVIVYFICQSHQMVLLFIASLHHGLCLSLNTCTHCL